MTEPLRPDQITKAKRGQIPDAVYEVFNELIAEKWNGSSATFNINEIVDRMCERMCLKKDNDIMYNKKWLDVEDSYRSVDWVVKYYRPDYDEDYIPFFKFSKKE